MSGKSSRKREHARLPALGGEHDGDRLGRADGIREVLGPLDLDLKADGGVPGRRALLQAGQRDGRDGAGGDGGCQLPRRRGSQVIRRCDGLSETGPPRVDAHVYPARAGVETMLAAPTVADTMSSRAPRSVISILVGFGLLADGKSIVTLNCPSLAAATRL